MKKNLSYLIDGKISTYQVFQPYDPVLCDFSDTLSKTLRSLKETKNYPDILTFAFWCRRANIKRPYRAPLPPPDNDKGTSIKIGIRSIK